MRAQSEKLRGAERALARPALGFALDQSTKTDVESWAKAHNIACTVPKTGPDLDCAKVPAEILPQAGGGPVAKSVWFVFDSHDRLVSVTAIRYDSDPESAASLYNGKVKSLAQTAGPPSKGEGETSAEFLSAGLWRQARSAFAFNDYHAQTSVTHLRQGEFMFVEEYRSLQN